MANPLPPQLSTWFMNDPFLVIILQLDLWAIDLVGDLTNYQENGEFKLEQVTAEKNCVYYSCCINPFLDLTYYIELRRRPMFYVFNLILPCVLINGIGTVLTIYIYSFQNNFFVKDFLKFKICFKQNWTYASQMIQTKDTNGKIRKAELWFQKWFQQQHIKHRWSLRRFVPRGKGAEHQGWSEICYWLEGFL